MYVQDAWEELHARWWEELRWQVKKVQRYCNKEHLRKEDFIFAALTPTPEGPPLLALPATFEVGDPAGYYQTVIVGRLERTADNAYWESAHRAQLRPLAAGGAEVEDPGRTGGGFGMGDPTGGLKAGGGARSGSPRRY